MHHTLGRYTPEAHLSCSGLTWHDATRPESTALMKLFPRPCLVALAVAQVLTLAPNAATNAASPAASVTAQPVHPEVAYADARHELVVRRVANERRLIEAKLAVALAKVQQTRYRQVEAIQQRSALHDAIKLAKKRNEQAEERLHWSERLANKGLISQASLELDQAAAVRTAAELTTAEARLATFTNGGHTRRLRELATAIRVAQAKQQLIQTTMTAELKELEAREHAAKDVVDEQVHVGSPETSLDLLQASLGRAKTELAAQEKFHDSELERAESAIATARRKLAEINESPAAQTINQQQHLIRTIGEALDAAQQQVAWSERVLRKGYLTPSEVQADRLRAMEKTIELKAAKLKLQLTEEFILPLTKAELEARVRLSERDRARIEQLRDAAISRATTIVHVRQRAYQLELARARGRDASPGSTTGATAGAE